MKTDGIKGNIARALVGCGAMGVAAAWVAGCGSDAPPPPPAPAAVVSEPPVGPAVVEYMEQLMVDHGGRRGTVPSILAADRQDGLTGYSRVADVMNVYDSPPVLCRIFREHGIDPGMHVRDAFILIYNQGHPPG
jgi:hypothetical protein